MDFDDPRFKHESYRLHTFQDFPRSNIVSPVELARDGFLYMGVGDRVGCVYCLRSLNNWQPDADPRVEHESMNPHSCPFVLGYDVGNVPIDRRDPRRNTSMDSHRPRIPVS